MLKALLITQSTACDTYSVIFSNGVPDMGEYTVVIKKGLCSLELICLLKVLFSGVHINKFISLTKETENPKC